MKRVGMILILKEEWGARTCKRPVLGILSVSVFVG